MVEQALERPVVRTARGAKADHAAEALGRLEKTEYGRLRIATIVSALQGLFAVAQAGVAAYALGATTWNISSGMVAWLALSYLLLTTMRIAVDLIIGRIAFVSAQSIVRQARTEFLERSSQLSPLSPGKATSAAGASLLGEKLDLLIPYYSRYRLSEAKARIVPLSIVLAAASLS